jgi:hypothetical protein
VRKSFEITKDSAVNLVNWKLGQELKSPHTPMMRKMALQAALSQNVAKEVADVLYGMGLRLSGDENDPQHQKWLELGSIQKLD